MRIYVCNIRNKGYSITRNIMTNITVTVYTTCVKDVNSKITRLLGKTTVTELSDYINYLENCYTYFVNDILSKHFCNDVVGLILSFINLQRVYKININFGS